MQKLPENGAGEGVGVLKPTIVINTHNPVVQGVDNAIRAAWQDMQGYRNEARGIRLLGRNDSWYARMAREQKRVLSLLLQIRKGEWA